MARIVAVVLGLIVTALAPLAAVAAERQRPEVAMANSMRRILRMARDPERISAYLGRRGARLMGMQEARVAFARDGQTVRPVSVVTRGFGPGSGRTPASAARTFGPIVKTNAGQKAEFTLTMWVYEWRKENGD